MTARAVVLLAHGSPDPRHRADVEVLAEAVASRAGAPVVAAYLDHHGPTPADAAHSMGAAWVVPLLLSDGFHRRVDVPAALAQMRGVAGGLFDLVAPAFPVARLLAAAAELILSAGVRPDPSGRVVVVVSESRSGDLVGSLQVAGRARTDGWAGWDAITLGDDASWNTLVAAAMAIGQSVGVVVPLFVARGTLLDRAVARARGLGFPVTTGSLATTATYAELVQEAVAKAQSATQGCGATAY